MFTLRLRRIRVLELIIIMELITGVLKIRVMLGEDFPSD